MSAVILMDTSIYLNVLNVPEFNQDREAVLAQFESYAKNGDSFLLPMASIWETGNHIADLDNGGLRRQYAQKLVKDVENAIQGNVPYRATYFPSREEFLSWLADFPDYAGRSKSPARTREGVSLADMSIIKEWERTCKLHPMTRVSIWSLDQDLTGYDRIP
jgi:hypothetical protein